MHYPEKKARRRFGRVSIVGNVEVVHHTTQKTAFICDRDTRRLLIINPDLEVAAKDARRAIRDQIFLPYWEKNDDALTIHSSSVCDDSGNGILAVGAAGGGTTSFFLQAICSGSRYHAISSDRTIVIPRATHATLIGSPEKINLFPGNLMDNAQWSSLLPTAEPESAWLRTSKLQVHWRTLFEPYERNPFRGEVRLKGIVFPSFGVEDKVTELSEAESLSVIESEILTSGEPIKFPNWLAWDHPKHQKIDISWLARNRKTLLVSWSQLRSIVPLLDKVMRNIGVSR